MEMKFVRSSMSAERDQKAAIHGRAFNRSGRFDEYRGKERWPCAGVFALA
ncbi:hypothetical protein [Rhodanobacter thiooxydans]|nr:hypothetical protein [Rhodanobacter thiooxydans]